MDVETRREPLNRKFTKHTKVVLQIRSELSSPAPVSRLLVELLATTFGLCSRFDPVHHEPTVAVSGLSYYMFVVCGGGLPFTHTLSMDDTGYSCSARLRRNSTPAVDDV